MVFIKDGTSVRNVLETRPSGRNEGTTAVVVDKSFKSSLYDYNEEPMVQAGDHLVANKEAIKLLVENDSHIERFHKNAWYLKRE